MSTTRIIVIGVAVVAAGLAGFVALNLTKSEPIVSTQIITEQTIERIETVQVLVAKDGIPVGARLNADMVEWKNWPEDSTLQGYIVQRDRPDAVQELAGTVVRLPIFIGEPIRPEKIVDSSSRIMSSLLPAGKRAVATQISEASGAGGFILPNDRVDVIMVRRDEVSGTYLTENILQNIRVLAIDQQIEEGADGARTVVGSTATLELTPDQSQVIVVAQQMAERITLALRSVADAADDDSASANHLVASGDERTAVQVIRTGKIGDESDNLGADE